MKIKKVKNKKIKEELLFSNCFNIIMLGRRFDLQLKVDLRDLIPLQGS